MTGVGVILALRRARPTLAAGALPASRIPICPDPKLLAHDRPVKVDDLIQAAAYFLKVATSTSAMLADERAEAESHRERAAIAAVTTGRVDLATAYRVPLFALTGAPRLLLWTAASKALRVRGQTWLRRSALRSWGEVWDAVEAAPLAGLPAAVALDLRGEALQELQACREVRANGRAVAELAGSIDVRARAVGELLVPVLAAIGEGAPLLETGERLRAALRAWEG